MMDNIERAVARIKTAHEISMNFYKKPIEVMYSGGKDSDVMLHLFLMSGLPFSVVHSLTTVDSPDTMRHIQTVFQKLDEKSIPCKIHKARYKDGKQITMWNLIQKKGILPWRTRRFCCEYLKESYKPNSMIALGVRKSESVIRAERNEFEYIGKSKKDAIRLSQEEIFTMDNKKAQQAIEHCINKDTFTVNPIIDWSSTDIWEFIHDNHIPYNPMYELGLSRCGCIGCPMAGYKGMAYEFYLYPKYKVLYTHAAQRLLDSRKLTKYKTVEEVIDAWMGCDNIPGQYKFDF